MRTLRTVTLNTGYDDYYTVGDPVWGGVAPMHAFRSVCSGKGISCARAAVALGVPTVAYGLVGGDDWYDFGSRLKHERIPHRLVAVPGGTRHNLTLVDATGEKVAAHFMAQGFTLTGPDDVRPLVDAVLADVQPGDLVTLNGSTPTRLPATTWAGLARAVLDRGAEVVVDAQKDALVAALDVPGVLAFKPNDEEILAIPEVAAADEADRVAVALDVLRRAGVRLPMVSLGEHGVAYADPDGSPRRASLPVERPVQSVMAGDSFVAGLAWGRFASDEPADWLRHALAAAAAHVAGFAGQDLRSHAEFNLTTARLP
ncbi:1-phosphofructokinase [Tessaracoccus lubricantis]|uniref:1-phosphofructokinase n=1 Tax=Tessaracoccus lubricantis TaxID=545543 RepID=A0ABP9EY33_9ACTN